MQAKLAQPISPGAGSGPIETSHRLSAVLIQPVLAPRLNSLTGEAKRKVETCGVPSSQAMRGAKRPAFGFASAAARMARKKPGRTTASELRSR